MSHFKKIKEHYIDRILDSENHYKVLDWESEDAQTRRFAVLTEEVPLNGKSLLDVGCGLGDLDTFLISRDIAVDYTGVDILQDMIDCAKRKHPQKDFRCINLFDTEHELDRQYDIVFTSGIFNLNLGNNEVFFQKAMEVFFALAGEMVVFNMLHEKSPDPDPTYYYTHPDKIRRYLERFEADVRIVEGYLPNDFTVICKLRREQNA